MRHPRIIIASVSLASGPSAAVSPPPRESQQRPRPARTPRRPCAPCRRRSEARPRPSWSTAGLPLYDYLNDTAAKSAVTGGLAALWPPLTSASPAATG